MRGSTRLAIVAVLVGGVGGCATAARPGTRNGMSLPSVQVSVPSNPDSAWAVSTAVRIFADHVTQQFDVLSFCKDRNGFLVDITPAGAPRTLGGGGLVFISLSGTAIVLVPYQ